MRFARPVGVHPPLDSPAYRSSQLRAPHRPALVIPQTISEITGPVLGERNFGPLDADLTRQHDGEPLGERIIVHGRVLDGSGRPVPATLVEVWQANAAGRYQHDLDRHPAPLDPNFSGAGRFLTGPDGTYRFVTIKPGSYPWKNHHNAWRPAHIHFSCSAGRSCSGWSRRCTFPGDPLFPHDPIFNSVPDEGARQRMVGRVRPRRHRARMGLGVPVGHRAPGTGGYRLRA